MGGESPPGRQNELLYFKVGASGSIYQGAWKKAESLRAEHAGLPLAPGACFRIALPLGGDAVLKEVYSDGWIFHRIQDVVWQSEWAVYCGRGGVPVFLQQGYTQPACSHSGTVPPHPLTRQGEVAGVISRQCPPPPPPDPMAPVRMDLSGAHSRPLAELWCFPSWRPRGSTGVWGKVCP